jgi:ketosteroid isomerase-like protein
MRYSFFLFIFLAFAVNNATAQCSAKMSNDIAAIRKVLREQEQAWNRADIEAFMQGYWHSENLEFVGKNGLQNGWQRTLDNYKKSYPDAAAMGKLDFTILKLELLGKNAAYIGILHYFGKK